METKWVLLSSISGVVVIGLIMLIVISNSSSPNLSSENENILEDCKTLQYNGNNKINIVFFSDSDISKDYVDYFLASSPYNLKKENFNFFYIDSYIPECEIYKGIAILCYSKDLVRKASSCPVDIIAVIKDSPPEIRSSSYMNVLSINIQHPKTVLLHEIGHSLANLADEYLPSQLPKKSKNCVEDCKDFKELNEGCFSGCSESNRFRAIEEGVMRTLSSKSYGKFNELLINEKIDESSSKGSEITSFAINKVVNCSEEEYALITGNYQNKNITIKDKTIEKGCLGNNGAGDFTYKINTETTTLKEKEFNPEFIFTDNLETGSAIEYQGEFSLKIPIVEDAKSLEILKEEQIIAETSLSDISSRPCKIE